MPKKSGDICKEKLTQAILGLYPDNAFVQDKNIYVNFVEGGETVQLKLALTQPKVPVEAPEAASAPIQVEDNSNWDWSDSNPDVASRAVPSAEVTQEEQEHLRALLQKLGL